jgi:hypothetical protein
MKARTICFKEQTQRQTEAIAQRTLETRKEREFYLVNTMEAVSIVVG